MWLFNARVYHLDKDVCIVYKFNHQLLVLLHMSERILINNMGVVEKQVILRRKLNLDVLNIVILTLQSKVRWK